MMNKNRSIILFTLLAWSTVLIGQAHEYECYPLFKLEEESQIRKGQVYIVTDSSEITDQLNVFLINRSDSKILFSGYHGVVKFEREAINEDGNWERIDVRKGYCGTGYGLASMPSNHYSLVRIDEETFNDGDFATQIRFIFETEDSIIISNSIKANIDYNRFFSEAETRKEKELEGLLKEGKLSKEEEKRLYSIKLKNRIKNKEYEELLVLTRLILDKYPNFSEARYYYGVALVSSIPQEDEVTREEKNKVVVIAIEELNKIPTNSKVHSRALIVKKVYEEYLNKEQREKKR